MPTIKKFEYFICWKEARTLNQVIRKFVSEKRFENDFRLIHQMLGSAGSIMDNIAEGHERGGNKEFIQFLYYSKGSCAELRSQSFRALDAGFLTQAEFEYLYEKTEKVSFLIFKLINYLKQSDIKGYKYIDKSKENQ
jgi:four helix bundle protein